MDIGRGTMTRAQRRWYSGSNPALPGRPKGDSVRFPRSYRGMRKKARRALTKDIIRRERREDMQEQAEAENDDKYGG